jgi:curved DNA-binding protein CbpA
MGNNQTKQKYINDIKNNVEYDSYKIFNLDKNFTWDGLRKSYKKLALKAHPDKGGDKIIFDYITEKFYELANEYKLRTSNKNYNELKNDFADYAEKNNKPEHNDKFNDDLTTSERINKHFNETKIYDDDYDFGYGDTMIKSTKERLDFKFENIFGNKQYSNKSFNEVFDKNVTISNEVVKYDEPKPMILAKNLNYSEIGAGKNSDYSSSVEKTNNLAYTDYMKAHSTNRLVNASELNNFKEFKNADEYKKHSDRKLNKKYTSKELDLISKKEQEEEKKELDRLERIKKQNIEILKAYNKANSLMLR